MGKDFFCPEPYKNLSSKSYGYWQACCIASDESVRYHGMKVTETKFLDFYNSDYMRTLRKDMLEGNMSDTVKMTCRQCIYNEKISGVSRRTQTNLIYDKTKILNEGLEIDLIRVKHIGNLCNAKCVTCFPEVSSLFAQEATKLGTYNGPIVISTEPTEVFYEGMLEILPFTKKVKFIGGEPLFNPLTWEFIDWLDKNNLTHLELHFTTNGRQFFKPKQLKVLKKFKYIKTSISIDAYGDKNYYIRYPSDFTTAIENVKKFKDSVDLCDIFTTVSILNIGYIKELKDYLDKEIPNTGWNCGTVVESPKLFRPNNIPDELKDKYLSNMYQDPRFESIINSPFDELLFKKTIKFLKTLDKSRNLVLTDFWPEFKSYYE